MLKTLQKSNVFPKGAFQVNKSWTVTSNAEYPVISGSYYRLHTTSFDKAILQTNKKGLYTYPLFKSYKIKIL